MHPVVWYTDSSPPLAHPHYRNSSAGGSHHSAREEGVSVRASISVSLSIVLVILLPASVCSLANFRLCWCWPVHQGYVPVSVLVLACLSLYLLAPVLACLLVSLSYPLASVLELVLVLVLVLVSACRLFRSLGLCQCQPVHRLTRYSCWTHWRQSSPLFLLM